MATRPSTLDCKAFPFPVGRTVSAEVRPITRACSLPAVPCRPRRRYSYRRPLCVRPASTFVNDHHHDRRPEVEFASRIDRWRSTADTVELSPLLASRSVFRGSNLTAATSFQTCFEEDDRDVIMTTSSAEEDSVLKTR